MSRSALFALHSVSPRLRSRNTGASDDQRNEVRYADLDLSNALGSRR